MKFTIAEWRMIQEVIREERDKMEEADRVGELVVLPKDDNDLISEPFLGTKTIGPIGVHRRYVILNDIVAKLNNEEI